jgi:hypothetical protein
MSAPSRPSDPFTHGALLCVTLALAVFLGWQVKQSLAARNALRQAVDQRSILVNEAQATQARTAKQLEAFLSDLLVLAQNNPQAKAIVDRYGIRRNAPAAEQAAAR